MLALPDSVKVIKSNFYAGPLTPPPSQLRTLFRPLSPIRDGPEPAENTQLDVTHSFPTLARGWQ
jgi:hypothetical protein